MVNKSLTISLTKNSIRQILLSQVVDRCSLGVRFIQTLVWYTSGWYRKYRLNSGYVISILYFAYKFVLLKRASHANNKPAHQTWA